jgi:hypothetical protein
LGVIAGFLHELATGVDQLESVDEAERLGCGEGGKFAEGESGGGLELEGGGFFEEELKGDPADEVDSGLGVFRLGEFIFRAVEADLAEGVTQGVIGLVEESLGGRECLGEVAAHTDALGALSGEKQCSFLHLLGGSEAWDRSDFDPVFSATVLESGGMAERAGLVEVFVVDREQVERSAFGQGFFVGDLEPLKGVVAEGGIEGVLMGVGEELGQVTGADQGAEG